MGKEKFEDICVQNLSAKHFGKYVSGKLKVFSTARCCTEFTESPDFLFEINNECYGVEHFVIDLLYKEQEGVQRSGSRLIIHKKKLSILNSYESNTIKTIKLSIFQKTCNHFPT